MMDCVAGYGLGGSTVAMFGRVGGGIYTKAADVGADLVGKVVHGLEEDDPINPASIADNVGDNVGDIAGMGADLFGSFAESTCAALVIAAAGHSSASLSAVGWDALLFPVTISAGGIIICLLCSFVATNISPVKKQEDIEKVLKVQMVLTAALMLPVIYWLAITLLPSKFLLEGVASGDVEGTPMKAFVCAAFGTVGGLIIGLVTEYFTSHTYTPTRELATACKSGAAVNIIFGMALGYQSCIIPVFVLASSIYVSFQLCDLYGIALAALGMLSTLATGLTIDGFGPIADNAGGIAEMAQFESNVRKTTDALDAAGNTTAAIGKGFAIGSAALVSLALYGAFVTRVSNSIAMMSDVEDPITQAADAYKVNILEPFTFAGLLIGAMLPYWFSAMTMKAVGDAAQEMLEEIRRQFKEMAEKPGTEADHTKCISISTNASLKKMIAPGILVIVSPLLAGSLFGYQATNGILAGCIVSGIQIAFSASNSGGAWDNAKKYVEAGSLYIKGVQVKKGDDAHAAAVCGDTVGDPLKDTSGPSINILIKLSAICSLVFGTFLTQYGGLIAGGVKMVEEPENNVSPVIPTA